MQNQGLNQENEDVVERIADELFKKDLGLEKREAIAILSIGTFLEYFDLFLYIHLASVLNELFFPSTDAQSVSILSAFAFCSSFVFRPFGGILFGYIGDLFGRRITIFLTTGLMAITCFCMCIVPTYVEIGILASIIVTLLRALQGMSSLGEIVGAHLYVTESVRNQNKAASMSTIITTAATLGRFFAIIVAKCVIDWTGNWRIAFLIGSIIAIVGVLFRTSLRESCDFADANKRLPKNQRVEQTVDTQNVLAYFLMECMCPIIIYLAFVHCPMMLKNSGYDMSEVLSQSALVSLFEIATCFLLIYLASKYHPLKILKVMTSVYVVFSIVFIVLVNYDPSPFRILLFQIFTICFGPSVCPAGPIIFKSFPIFTRFRSVALTFAMSQAVMYSITAFGAAILTNYFGFYGLLIILTPLTIGYIWGLKHFIEREKKLGTYN